MGTVLRRRLLLPTVLAFLSSVALPSITAGDCQYCWDASPPTGQCLDVLDPSPSLNTLSQCRGIALCFPAPDGTVCIPYCEGTPCYWV